MSSNGRPQSDAQFTNLGVASRAVVAKKITATTVEAKTADVGTFAADAVDSASAVIDDLVTGTVTADSVTTDNLTATTANLTAATTSSLTIPTGATDGYVLTSDASGEGTWQEAAGGDTFTQFYGQVIGVTATPGIVSQALNTNVTFQISRLGTEVVLNFSFVHTGGGIGPSISGLVEGDGSGALDPFIPASSQTFAILLSDASNVTATIFEPFPGGPFTIDVSGNFASNVSGTGHYSYTVPA